jgi:hypothetical protein
VSIRLSEFRLISLSVAYAKGCLLPLYWLTLLEHIRNLVNFPKNTWYKLLMHDIKYGCNSNLQRLCGILIMRYIWTGTKFRDLPVSYFVVGHSESATEGCVCSAVSFNSSQFWSIYYTSSHIIYLGSILILSFHYSSIFQKASLKIFQQFFKKATWQLLKSINSGDPQ